MPTTSASNSDRSELRRQLRAARRALTPVERSLASLAAATRLLEHSWYLRAKRIALYYPIGSEADTSALFVAAQQDGKQIFLPRILFRGGRLLFVRWDTGADLGQRRHGIPQPRPSCAGDIAPARTLDLVIVPLLGFDTGGHRLGSGAGYYDRSFDFRQFRAHPPLVGFAFACQQLKLFKPDRWDIPMDAIVTESGWRESR